MSRSCSAKSAWSHEAQPQPVPPLWEGPTCAKELYDWPKTFVDELTNLYGREALVTNMSAKSGIVMTAAFSGVGSAEIAAGMICRALREEGLVNPGFDFYVHSVCDRDPMCREVLMRLTSFQTE